MAEGRYRVLLVTPFYEPNVGGVETHLLDLVAYLRGRGDHVTVVTYQPLVTPVRASRREVRDGAEVLRVRWPRGLFNLLEPAFPLQFAYLFPRLFVATARAARRGRFDVVHGHGLVGGAIAALVARMVGARGVTSLHTVYRLADRPALAWSVRPMLAAADIVLANSESGLRDLIDAGLPAAKTGRFAYWLDGDVFRPRDRAEARRRLGLGEGFVVLFVHRLTAQKGLPVMLEAARLLEARSDITFLFAGDGPLAPVVARAAGERRNVRFMGAVPNRELAWVYAAGDIMWGNPDLDYMGRASMEAMLCGCPVLAPSATQVMGVAAPVQRDRFPGIRFVAPEPGAVAAALGRLAEDRAERARMREDAAAYMRERAGLRNAEAVRDAYAARGAHRAAPGRTAFPGGAP